MTFYPIIIPTLNRYAHLQKCVDSLSHCTHADKTELIIGIDYPPEQKYVNGWQQIKEYVKHIQGFGKLTIFQHNDNQGSMNNSAFLVKYALSKYDAYIYTEDDNVFSPCFLDYMNKALEKYKYDESIIAVTGYMLPAIFPNTTTQANVMRLRSYSAWGIGRWRRSNIETESNIPIPYIEHICGKRDLLRKMKEFTHSLYQLIFWSQNNKLRFSRCDFITESYLIVNNKNVIAPTTSMVRNLGYDGSGEHCKSDDDCIFSNQTIVNDKTFDIKDNLSEQDNLLMQKIWERKRSQIPAWHFSKKEHKKTMLYYYSFMIFGFKLVDWHLRGMYKMVLLHPRYLAGWIKNKIKHIYKRS